MLRIGITGTDTGVGKTVVARALLVFLRSRGHSTGVMKPIETGIVRRGDPASDHVLLAAAAGMDERNADICPYVFTDPVAPIVAASREGKAIDLARLDAAFARICEERGSVVVEGAGGLLVPISAATRFDTLFARWKLDVIIVAIDRLGALNHVLLTHEAVKRAGLRTVAVVLNNPRVANDGALGNRAVLQQLLPDVPVLEFPHLTSSSGDTTLIGAAESSGLARVVEGWGVQGLPSLSLRGK